MYRKEFSPVHGQHVFRNTTVRSLHSVSTVSLVVRGDDGQLGVRGLSPRLATDTWSFHGPCDCTLWLRNLAGTLESCLTVTHVCTIVFPPASALAGVVWFFT